MRCYRNAAAAWRSGARDECVDGRHDRFISRWLTFGSKVLKLFARVSLLERRVGRQFRISFIDARNVPSIFPLFNPIFPMPRACSTQQQQHTRQCDRLADYLHRATLLTYENATLNRRTASASATRKAQRSASARWRVRRRSNHGLLKKSTSNLVYSCARLR